MWIAGWRGIKANVVRNLRVRRSQRLLFGDAASELGERNLNMNASNHRRVMPYETTNIPSGRNRRGGWL
jgi:hypothetical protein